VDDAPAFAAACAGHGLLVLDTGPRTLRFVTHYGIRAADVQRAIAICAEASRAA
jgi:acetylornithine/succinyldiaminopimelate/putrescine aminotransferase